MEKREWQGGYQEFLGLKIRNVEKGNVEKDVLVPVCAITFESDERYFNGINIKLILKGKYAKDIYANYLAKSNYYKPSEYKVYEANVTTYLSMNVLAEFRELRKGEVVFHNPIALGFTDLNIFILGE